MTEEFIKIATTAIVCHRDDPNIILIGKRKKDGLWEFPGGRIDPGESSQDCIVREIQEEVNISVDITRDLGVIEGKYRGINMKVFGFVTRWQTGEISENVHDQLKWIKMDQVNDYKFVDEDLVFWEKFKA